MTKERQVEPCATKLLNYQQKGNLLLQIMLKEKNIVILLLKEKHSLNLNLLKPSPTKKLVMIISEHWKIPSHNDSFKAKIIWLLKCVMNGCPLLFNGDLGDTLCAMYPGVEAKAKYLKTPSRCQDNHIVGFSHDEPTKAAIKVLPFIRTPIMGAPAFFVD